MKVQPVSPLALLILFSAASTPAEPLPAPGYAGARRAALEAGSTLKARLHARDAAARRTWSRPAHTSCNALAQAAVEVDAAWSAYVDALERVSVAAIGHPRHAESARLAARAASAERAADVTHTAEWAAWCAALPTAQPSPAIRGNTEQICEIERLDRAVIRRLSAGERPATLDQLQWLSDRFKDTLDFVFVVDMRGVDAADDAAHVWFDRRVPGVGRAPWHPAHLPGWRRLQGAIVIDGLRSDARKAPTLRAIARTFGNRWAIPGCARTHEGWGVSDAGGQLGGGSAVELIEPGTYRVRPIRPGARLGVVGNGGNGAPYAPIEQYLLGHRPLAEVPPLTLLRAPRALGDGRFAADGTCVVDQETIRQSFGVRPPRVAPWRIGVLLVAAPDTTIAALRGQLNAIDAFTRAGPDDDALLYNYYEATDGRGQLDWQAPIPRACPSRAQK